MKTLPPEYIAYCESDGPKEGELAVNPLWFILWSPEEIDLMNREYQVDQYAPEFLGFASSGGGEMLAFDEHHRIFTIPFIGMSSKDAIPVAGSWRDFVRHMR